MTQEQQKQPAVLSVGDLKKYLEIYRDDLPATVELANGELHGILDASTAVIQPGPVLVFRVSTIRTTNTSKKVEPVIVK